MPSMHRISQLRDLRIRAAYVESAKEMLAAEGYRVVAMNARDRWPERLRVDAPDTAPTMASPLIIVIERYADRWRFRQEASSWRMQAEDLLGLLLHVEVKLGRATEAVR